MNWNNFIGKQKDPLNEKASAAESRLAAIRKAGKTFKKSVEDSLKTTPKNRNSNDLEVRKKRTSEFILGDNVSVALQALGEAPIAVNVHPSTVSPFSTVLERFGNLEKTIGLMQAANDDQIFSFVGGDTPLCKLLTEDYPNAMLAKKDLEQLSKKKLQVKNNLDKERKKLERMENEEKEIEEDTRKLQQDKIDKIKFELENLTKDVSLEEDKLSSNLLTLVSRENRYAQSVLEIIRIKKQFYEDAFRTLDAELPHIEGILNDTSMRPVFGEPIESHLDTTNREIAFPIALTVKYLLHSGLNDEGVFRISPKQIKLDKMKAYIDSHQNLDNLLRESDCHLHSSLLKCYLRDLPEPLLGGGSIYDLWIEAARLQDPEKCIKQIKNILETKLSPRVVKNVQYLIKFLVELSSKSKATKMTPQNIAIVMGPTLLWSDRGFQAEQGNIELLISVIATLIQSYDQIFPEDISLMEETKDIEIAEPIPNIEKPKEKARPVSLNVQIPPNQNLAPEHSPNNKRKPSFRTRGKNFISKINGPSSSNQSSSSSSTSSQPHYRAIGDT